MFEKKIEVITNDIYLDAKFYSNTIYVILGEVRILPRVTLSVDYGTNIYIVNGSTINKFGKAVRSKLIFETGSKLVGTNIYFKACDSDCVPEKKANNGGVFFLGSASKASKDFIETNFSVIASNFNADYISLSYLGGKDNINLDEELDDYDAISIVGVGSNEWNVKNVYSEYSGDDGFDVENSTITLDSVIVKHATEDGLNITSSRVNILQKLIVDQRVTDVFDRDIFDLETDDGYSYVRLAQYSYIKINGIFGDQLTLVSDDLPQPKGDTPYKFEGLQIKGQSYIYSGKFAM